MNPLFKAEVYQNRRTQLKKAVKSGIAIFLGNSEAPMNLCTGQQEQQQHLYFG